MKPPNKRLLLKKFSALGIRYSENLLFQKEAYKALFLRMWSKNQDPTKRFLSVCFGEEIRTKWHPPVSIKPSSKGSGDGVFLEGKSLGKHAYVGEYVGMVRKGGLSTFFSPYSVSYPTPIFSFRGFVIDAEKTGNFTRYINHEKNPNLEMKSTLIDGLIRMIFVTKRPVESGEELTMNYGTFWAKLFFAQ
ncbi:MAG: SET domain-containing protein-lysine N-methyltransferase [Chlamydiota bacterium]